MSPLQVVIVETMRYPLFRRKPFGKNNYINCGLGNIIKNMSRYNPGVDCEYTVILNNKCDTINYYRYNSLNQNIWINATTKIPFIKSLLKKEVSVNFQPKYDKFLKKYPFIKKVVYRDGGMKRELGGYDYFYEYLRNINYKGHVLFMSSSVIGPQEDGWLLKYKNLFELEPDTGLCSISMNSHYTDYDGSMTYFPHCQSYS